MSTSVNGTSIRRSSAAASSQRWQPAREYKVTLGIPQHYFPDFANGRVRQLLDERDLRRALEPGQVALAVAYQLLGGDLAAGCAYDEGAHGLAAYGVGRAEHGDLGDPRMRCQDELHLVGVDVEPVHYDQLADPVDQEEIALGVG